MPFGVCGSGPQPSVEEIMSITFKVRSTWKEEEVVLRVAGIVCHIPNPMVRSHSNGFKWQLDGSNDWWMDIDPWPDEAYYNCILDYRYDSGEMVEALQIFLRWLFR